MRVPQEAGKGKAKVTVSFPDWKAGHVAPAIYEIAVVDPKPEAVSKDAQSSANKGEEK